jgi:6-pyruvoyl-tetrahydropterin synthase related domain
MQISGDQTQQSGAKIAVIALAFAASVIVLPMLFKGQASGHDFQFHLASWIEVARQWHQGTLYPHWAAWANYGFGEPRFIFYPPLSWLVGAALGTVLPWRMVPGAFIWLAIFTAGMCMFQFARRWMDPATAAACAVLYAINPYHLVIVYYRSDFAELLASAFFPLALCFAIRVGLGEWRSITRLALIFAAVWLSNAPAAVVLSYSLALLLVVMAVIKRSVRPLFHGAAGLATGLAFAAFYIVPAAFEQKWVDIAQALAPGLRFDQNFIFAHSNDPDFLLFNRKVSVIAVAVMLVGVLVVGLMLRRRREPAEIFWPLAILAAASAAMMWPVTSILWQFLPKLRFVQFPWRWLVPLNLCCWFLFCLATARLPRVRLRMCCWVAAGVTFTLVATVLVRNAWWDSEDIPVLLAAMDSGKGYEGTDEYAPIGCDHYAIPQDAPRISLVGARTAQPLARLHPESWQANLKVVRVDAARPAEIALKLVNYPAWAAEVSGQPTPVLLRPDTAQILIRVPPGSSEVTLRFTRTPDRAIGAAISLIAALFLSFLAIARRLHRSLEQQRDQEHRTAI